MKTCITLVLLAIASVAFASPQKPNFPNLQKFHKWTELDRGTQEAELYNLEADISEKNNVAKENPELMKKMLATAEKWKTE